MGNHYSPLGLEVGRNLKYFPHNVARQISRPFYTASNELCGAARAGVAAPSDHGSAVNPPVGRHGYIISRYCPGNEQRPTRKGSASITGREPRRDRSLKHGGRHSSNTAPRNRVGHRRAERMNGPRGAPLNRERGCWKLPLARQWGTSRLTTTAGCRKRRVLRLCCKSLTSCQSLATAHHYHMAMEVKPSHLWINYSCSVVYLISAFFFLVEASQRPHFVHIFTCSLCLSHMAITLIGRKVKNMLYTNNT